MQAKEPRKWRRKPDGRASGVQSEGGAGSGQKRADAGRTDAAIRCASEPDHGMEAAVAGVYRRCVRLAWYGVGRAAGGRESAAREIGQLTLENDFLSGALTKFGLLSAKR